VTLAVCVDVGVSYYFVIKGDSLLVLDSECKVCFVDWIVGGGLTELGLFFWVYFNATDFYVVDT